MDESLKRRLLKAVGNDSVMQAILANMMERTQAEFCGFHTARDRELAYIMIESRELSPRIPELRQKLQNAYRMFTNGLGSVDAEPLERVYCRKTGANVAYLVSDSKIESYFLVPLTFASKVRGVLFFGSIRKDAFGKNDIAVFSSLADEGDVKTPLIFRIGGEKEILAKLLETLPSGAALVSPDGRIVSANRAFGETLQLDGELPENVYQIGDLSCFNLHGVWEEFSILQKNVIDREIEGNCVPERYCTVSWVLLDDLSEDVGSLALIRDTTAAREQAEAREEMMAMVAHEIRTPLTGLKNSLAIVAENGSGGGAARFLSNASRTVDRLGRLVDSLIDSSSARIDERSLRMEPHDVRGYLEEITTLFLEPMRKKGIDFSIRVDGSSLSLTFDGDRIEQVLQNLLANSIKQVPAGGKISISAGPCEACPLRIIPSAPLPYIPPVAFGDLCLRDSGSGIPSDVAGRINMTGAASESPVRGSKGLGLVIAKRLVRLHGGSLVIEEGNGGGSGVHLYLPVDQETARIVQRLGNLELRLESMLARGLTPAVGCMLKDPDKGWINAVRSRRTPVIDPRSSDAPDDAMLLWPLSERFAVALAAEIDPVDGVRAGWAAGPREGTGLNELISVALERMEGAVIAPAS